MRRWVVVLYTCSFMFFCLAHLPRTALIFCSWHACESTVLCGCAALYPTTVENLMVSEPRRVTPTWVAVVLVLSLPWWQRRNALCNMHRLLHAETMQQHHHHHHWCLPTSSTVLGSGDLQVEAACERYSYRYLHSHRSHSQHRPGQTRPVENTFFGSPFCAAFRSLTMPTVTAATTHRTTLLTTQQQTHMGKKRYFVLLRGWHDHKYPCCCCRCCSMLLLMVSCIHGSGPPLFNSPIQSCFSYARERNDFFRSVWLAGTHKLFCCCLKRHRQCWILPC